jgi:hypothetical protein
MALFPPFRSSSGRAARGLINAAPDQGPWVGADRPDDSDEFDYFDEGLSNQAFQVLRKRTE